ncbi:MAG: hypothetical protein HY905_02350 [Deltaproteobacteria bacterium]|nr:hypothetical protein [Deltaproteobacteria bacterium]
MGAMIKGNNNKKAIVVARAPDPLVKESPLPGEKGIRQELIDAAVREINHVYVSKGLETAKWIGDYVLQKFFDGKSETFRRRGMKHISFRKLCVREDLNVSHAFLWNCVGLVDQLKELPDDIANALPVSHHTALLPVHDEKVKLTLAKKAVRENLSKRELAAEVRKVGRSNGNGAHRGRRPMTPTARLVSGLGQLAVLARSHKTGSDDELASMTPGKLNFLVGEADRHLAALKAFVERVRRQAAHMQAPTEHPLA